MTPTSIQWTLLGALCLANTAVASGEILLTMDPDKRAPTFVDETTSTKRMEFRAVNYQEPDAPEPFTVVFEPSFAGQYNPDTSKYTAGKVLASGEVEFVATLQKPGGGECRYDPPGNGNEVYKCYIVELKLLNGPKKGSPGFLYRIDMGGGTIDPRVRPK